MVVAVAVAGVGLCGVTGGRAGSTRGWKASGHAT